MSVNTTMRVYHRYLGFFLAGIMAVYALSGIVLIFRDTDFLKSEKQQEKTLSSGITPQELGKELKIKDLKILKQENGVLYFGNGTFDTRTGVAHYTKKQLPWLLERMTRLHKADSSHPLFFLNIFFGLSLLFFVISAFWMFLPGSTVFRKGLYFALGGIVLTLVLLWM